MDGSAGMRKAAAFLARLRRDARGNVLALVAASLVPLIGLAGGSVDISRLYLSKVRLQHACDAGALAGRKAMGAGGWNQTAPSPKAIADQFFTGNFAQGSYGTTTITHGYTGADGVVTGNASVVVPMAMMSFFGMAPQTVSVTCQAKVEIPNTDVMFVLDNTGSMADKANASDPQNKITTLKYAVKCFYESLTQLTTNAGCPAGTSTGAGIGSNAQVRFGFVPYNSNVNVGRLLPSSWFANSWKYQSRAPRVWVLAAKSGPTVSGTPTMNVTQSGCTDAAATQNGLSPTTDTKTYDPANSISDAQNKNHWVHSETKATATWSNGVCKVTQQTSTWTYDYRENVYPAADDKFDVYRYGVISEPLATLKNGNGWNNSFTLPLGTSGAARTITWDGCIEERATVRASSYDPIPPDARDLDIDAIPDQGDPKSLWAPALPTVIFPRTSSGWQLAEVNTAENFPQSNYSSNCPASARKMQIWSEPTAFDEYVDNLQPAGTTYHDIGMLWGGRLLSPTGLFKSENAMTPSGGTIQRYMIFMTDGDTNTSASDYAAYGLSWFDRRETDPSAVPGGGSGAGAGSLTQQVNLRFAALCSAVKNKGVALYVVSFGGSGIAADTKQRLQACATDSNHYYDATSASQLKAAFASIAAQITQLRLAQ